MTLPTNRVFEVGNVVMKNNWCDQNAYIADEDDESLLKLHKHFIKAGKLKLVTTKRIGKASGFKTKLGSAAESIAKASSSSQALAPRRRLSKRVSDVSIPEEMLATPKSKAARVSGMRRSVRVAIACVATVALRAPVLPVTQLDRSP